MSESEDSEHEERSLNIVNMPDSDELSLYSVNTSDSEDISQNASSNDNYEPEIQVNPYTIYPRPLNFNIPPELQFETHYDRSLTAAHQYLGDGLREVSGRTVYEEGFVHTIPIIFLKLNLLPGQILPIIAHSSDIKLILKYAIFRNRSFGVSYKLNRNKPTYGTIAEIYEHSVDIETTESFQIKAMGHQRYEILQIHSFPESCEQSLALGKIRIVPEITLVHPYNKLCLNPNKRHSSHDDKCRKKDMWQTQWPSWVYKQYDVYELASRLSKKVKMLYKDVKISDDPNLLSFQVTKLGIFSQEQVSELLGTESTNIRLQFELLYWNKIQSMQKFMCARSGCGIPICNMSNVFPMSPEGPQGTYCNSWGKIHDMITVTELDEDLNVTTVGTPSTECCWFPGYQWTIIMCPNCHSHLGWNYLVEDNLPLTPKLFYGLCVSAITSIKDYLVPDRERLEEINDGEMLITF